MKNVTIPAMPALVLAVTLLLATPVGFAQQQPQPAAAPMQTAAPAAQSSLCGNNPLCFEASDFVATISQFRVSPWGNGGRIIDVILHFQNKTNQALSLGYVNGSGSALDDRGNRFGMDAYRGGLRGMGIINGNNMDPKFVLRPGGSADAAFELGWGGGALSGVSYSLDLDIREINAVEGNQWVLGTETFLHYQSLANGMGTGASGSSGSSYLGSSASQPGCASGTTTGTAANATNAAGAQNSNSQAAVGNAQATLSSLKSIFGSKKSSAPATTSTASAAPCTPMNATDGNPSSLSSPMGNAAVAPSSGAAVPATAPSQNAGMTPAAAKSATTQPKPTGVTNASSVQRVPSSQPAKPPATTKTSTTTPPPAKTTPQ